MGESSLCIMDLTPGYVMNTLRASKGIHFLTDVIYPLIADTANHSLMCRAVWLAKNLLVEAGF